MTRARLTCGWPLSTAKVPPAVSACPPPILFSPTPLLHPWHLTDMDLLCWQLHTGHMTPKTSTTFQCKWRKLDLHYGFGKITGVLASETIRVMGEPGAESGLALGATNACKTDALPAGRDCLSENPLVAGHLPSRALSLGRQLPC